MSSFYNADDLLNMGKAKMRQYHREQDAVRLAREARQNQPEKIKMAVKKIVNFFKPQPLEKDDAQSQACSKTATESM